MFEKVNEGPVSGGGKQDKGNLSVISAFGGARFLAHGRCLGLQSWSREQWIPLKVILYWHLIILVAQNTTKPSEMHRTTPTTMSRPQMLMVLTLRNHELEGQEWLQGSLQEPCTRLVEGHRKRRNLEVLSGYLLSEYFGASKFVFVH